MNMEKSCQQKNSDSSKKFVRKPFIAIRRGPVLYTPKNAISRGSRRRARGMGACTRCWLLRGKLVRRAR